MSKQFYNNLFFENQDETWNDAPGKLVILKYLYDNFSGFKGKYIDIGCGSGYFTNKVAEALPNLDVYGFDFSETAIEKAIVNYPLINFFVDDVHNRSWSKIGPFDIAVSYGCFEHFEKPEIALKMLSDGLKPGGLFLLMIPTLGFYRKDRDDEGWYPDFNDPPQLQWNLKRSSWEEKFSTVGLSLSDMNISEKYGAHNTGNFYFGINN
jgi:SAM-dependent methyltransferase